LPFNPSKDEQSEEIIYGKSASFQTIADCLGDIYQLCFYLKKDV
jgi:hypothetical protein